MEEAYLICSGLLQTWNESIQRLREELSTVQMRLDAINNLVRIIKSGSVLDPNMVLEALQL